jgi:hypothetical protein
MAVEGQARVGHLDHERGAGRVRIGVVARMAGHHREIGLGLGLVVERDRRLHTHEPAWWQHRAKRVVDPLDRGGVIRSLWLGDDQLAAEELDGIAHERT